MKILLSPAKLIDVTRKVNSSESTSPTFLEDSAYLASKLKKMSAKKIGKLMHLSPELSDLNYERYQEWNDSTTEKEGTAKAIAAFNGEVYRGLDAESLSAQELKRSQDKIRILSGLYGILKPLDVIYPYRLEMGTKWAVTPKQKNLYAFWGNKLASFINEEESDVIINLASTEYFKAVSPKDLKARVITPVFKEFKNGEYKTIMVFAKKARGFMARYIIQNNIDDPELIKGFDTEGYHFDANMSSDNEWVFTR